MHALYLIALTTTVEFGRVRRQQFGRVREGSEGSGFLLEGAILAVHDYDRLTGGTFMVLCKTAKRPPIRARDTVAGKSDGLNNRELLKALIEVFVPGYPEPADSTFPQNASDYHTCKVAQGIYLPFDQESLVEDFDRQVRTKYSQPLRRMSEFIDRFIDVEHRGAQLAERLIGLITADRTITDSQELFVNSDGRAISKSDLTTASGIELDALLLGTWHYVVTNVPDNTVGRATFERWHDKPATTHKQWKLRLDAIPSLERTVSVTRSPHVEGTTNVESEEPEVVEAEFITDEEELHTGSAFVDDSESSTGDSGSARVVVFQGGMNNTNIGNVDTLNLGRWS